MTTVIVGGGLVGLCVAAALLPRSREVVVLDASETDDGASSINCGWLTPAHSRPLPSPSTLRRSVGWLVRGGGPLSVRPRLDPALLRWLIGFAWSSRPGQETRGLAAMAKFAIEALPAYEVLAVRGVTIEDETAGSLVAFLDASQLEREAASMREAADLGLGDPEVLRGDAALAREPGLAPGVAGIIAMGGSRVVRPERLLMALREHLISAGAQVRRGVRARAFTVDRGAVRSVATNEGPTSCDELIIAAGAWSPALTAKLDVSE